MAENRKEYDWDAKWDACLDLSLRRFVYSSVAGAFTGLLLFRQFSLSFTSPFFLKKIVLPF